MWQGSGLVKVRTVRRTTADGFVELEDHVEVGREYVIDISSRREERMRHAPTGTVHTKEIVAVIENGARVGWMAVELLALGALQPNRRNQ